jgi:hypothetical protein
MPARQNNGSGQAGQAPPEILPPEPIGTILYGAEDVTAEARDIWILSLQWNGLDDNDRQKVVEGALAMTARHKRGFNDWLKAGEALALLRKEIKQRSNDADRGRRYNRFWKELAPAPLRQIAYHTRTHAVWLWENQERVSVWWATVTVEQQLKWSDPLTIKRQFDRAHPPTDPPHDDNEDEQPRPRERPRRGQAAAIDEATQTLHGTVDRVDHVVRNLEAVTGGSGALDYDLSTPELIYQSADNFRAIHGGVYGDEALAQFTEALRDTNPERVSGPEWVPGSNWWGDSEDEVAGFHYRHDPERAVRIANKILGLRRADRRRARQPTQAEPDRVMRPAISGQNCEDPSEPPRLPYKRFSPPNMPNPRKLLCQCVIGGAAANTPPSTPAA